MTVEDRADLERLIADAQARLGGLERKALFTSDPIARSGLRDEIETLQRELFDYKKRLDVLLLGDQPTRTAIEPTKVFISYTHADQRWVDRLRRHLRPLSREHSLQIWDDRRIVPGTPWRTEIAEALASSRVAILLVSADFLASDYVANEELPLILEKAKAGEMQVLPIIVSPCAFDRTRLAQFQAVNSPSSPLVSKSKAEQDMILSHVADSIERYLAAPA